MTNPVHFILDIFISIALISGNKQPKLGFELKKSFAIFLVAVASVSVLGQPALANTPTASWYSGVQFTASSVQVGANLEVQMRVVAPRPMVAGSDAASNDPTKFNRALFTFRECLQAPANYQTTPQAFSNTEPATCRPYAIFNSPTQVIVGDNTSTLERTSVISNYFVPSGSVLVGWLTLTDSDGNLISFFTQMGGSPSQVSEPAPSEFAVAYGGSLIQSVDVREFEAGETGTMVITGKRLSRTTSLSVDGREVKVLAKSSRSLTLEIPAIDTSGSYNLVINTTHGQMTVMRLIIIK